MCTYFDQVYYFQVRYQVDTINMLFIRSRPSSFLCYLFIHTPASAALQVVDKTLGEFPGLLVHRRVPCPACMERKPGDPNAWGELPLEVRGTSRLTLLLFLLVFVVARVVVQWVQHPDTSRLGTTLPYLAEFCPVVHNVVLALYAAEEDTKWLPLPGFEY